MGVARRARLLFLVAAATALVGEVAARVGQRWLPGPTVAGPTADRENLPAPPGKVIHPYLGFVRDPNPPPPSPDIPPTDAQGLRRWPQDDGATSAYIVAILGSSVAERFSYSARQSLLAALAAEPAFAGRALAVRNYAMGGFKQPQQLAMLTQLLADGEQPDLVVQID